MEQRIRTEPERFVEAHGAHGGLSSDVSETAESGYHVGVECTCGAAFERWITPEVGERNLLRSRLLTFPK